jgi:hypothetical protein
MEMNGNFPISLRRLRIADRAHGTSKNGHIVQNGWEHDHYEICWWTLEDSPDEVHNVVIHRWPKMGLH